MLPRRRIWALSGYALTLLAGIALAAPITNPWQQEQSLPVELGTSGGNVNNASKAFCCSGTLGSLIQDSSGNQYILSNNHVLADTDTKTNSGGAPFNDDVSQPGLVDVGCNANSTNSNIVAHVTNWVPLGTHNVDAAIAEVVPGDVSGSILGIGPISTSVATPLVGEAVAKSGRTTQLTCASLSTVDASVKVRYQAGCGKGRKFSVIYTGQVVINSSSFSAGGDSGSLIVDQSTVQPVGLLYAGSSTVTIANPASDVLSALNAVNPSPTSFNFVSSGSPKPVSCPSAAASPAQSRLSHSSLQHAINAKRQHEKELLADDAIVGVGVGASSDNPFEPVVLVYIEQGRAFGHIPDRLDGVRTELIRTEAFQAYGWNEPSRRTCRAN
ncbi:MAG TPA: hypothetical protein VKB66_07125 [Candidatus Acidoferrum sp.]|nr:hypothetical protein [Candidatus Acidoferrum sp.]